MGSFPRPVQTGGPRSAKWVSAEIDEWIMSRPKATGVVYGDLDTGE